MQEFLNRLKTSLKKIGTQKEVAEKTDINPSTVTRYLSGSTTAYEYRFLEFLASNDVDLNWLIKGKSGKNKSLEQYEKVFKGFQMQVDALETKAKALEQLYETTNETNKELRLKIKEMKEKEA